MSKRMVAALSTALLFTSCVKEITSDERLERETKSSEALNSSTAGDLKKMKCDDITSELSKARDDTAPEEKRLSIYTDLFDRVKDRTSKFEEALSRNPDLAYQEGSQELISAKEQCIQQVADVRLEFERYVRELVDVPTVQEIKGGATVVVARLDFEGLNF